MAWIDETPSGVNASPAQPRRKRWVRVLIGVALSSGVTTLVLVLLLRSVPSYWSPPHADDPGVVLLAESVESRVTSQTTAVRGKAEDWTLELTDEDVNAWLAVRLPMWLANQGVESGLMEAVPHAMAHFSPDGPEVALELRNNGVTQIVRLAYEVQTDPRGGSVALSLSGMYAGRLRVPAEMVLERAAGQLTLDEREKEKALRVIRRIDAKLQLEDGRVVEVVAVELGEGRITLHCRTFLKRAS